MITCSIVIYYKKNISKLKSKLEILYKNIEFLSNDENISGVAIIDNSPDDRLNYLSDISNKVKYLHLNGKNIGFGKAHNISRELLKKEKYHIVVNPDIIYTGKNIISELKKIMDQRDEISLIQPLIFSQDNRSIQRLCKRNPTLFVQFIRAFLGKYIHRVNFLNRYNSWYEMENIAYKFEEVESEFLSGCFMFIRRSSLDKVNWFDQDYFLYLEDADLTRKLSSTGKCIHYPKLRISHVWERGSYKNWKLKLIAISSFFIYSFKWGLKIF